ncbi:MAG: methyltransferase domain-containing protein [Bacteroides sp.]|jgi:ubiquinone/menaquinone biosynthesis C-methylase UbiE|nr:methyltransferase domain-containing protein [Bacteroides sp.]
MPVQEDYNAWAWQYDSSENKTRDLEAFALSNAIGKLKFDSCLELGCGTGKNTRFLLSRASRVVAVDFSKEMLAIAREKLREQPVNFIQADIAKPWNIATQAFDLITFSLVLEHIEDLNHVFSEASLRMKPNGFLYLGELHPFKQYTGSKARFENTKGTTVLSCFTHNISDFTQVAKSHGFSILDIREYFDENDQGNIPRILSLLFRFGA